MTLMKPPSITTLVGHVYDIDLKVIWIENFTILISVCVIEKATVDRGIDSPI